MRTAEISRKTKETEIVLKLDLDGAGAHEIDTGVGFFNHMPVSYTHLGQRKYYRGQTVILSRI